jgi:hypothetical protein
MLGSLRHIKRFLRQLFPHRCSPSDLGRKIVEDLALHPGESFEYSKLRNGAIMISKPDRGEPQP